MNDKEKLDYKVGLYGRMQLEMINIGLLTADGAPKSTKHMNENEEDAIKIYDHLSFDLKGVDAAVLNERASRTNEIAASLINEDTMINNYLLSMMLYRVYLQEIATKFERLMVLPKIERQIKIYEKLDDDEYKKIRKTTGRVADNIWRVFTGKLQVSDEIRDLRANKFKRDAA